MLLKKSAKRPISIVIISSLLALEALLLAGEGLALIYSGLGAIQDFSGVMNSKIVFLAGWFFLFAAFLAIIGHYFFRGRQWTKSPALVWQLLMVVVSFSNMQIGLWIIVPGICATVIVLLLFTKPVTQFFVSAAGPGK